MMMWKVRETTRSQRYDAEPFALRGGVCGQDGLAQDFDYLPGLCRRKLGTRVRGVFRVQLEGCGLRCADCSLASAGRVSKPSLYSSDRLIEAFIGSGQDVFDLAGGSPARELAHWHEIVDELPGVFHSHFLLTERAYDAKVLDRLARFTNIVCGVSIEGLTPRGYLDRTGVRLDSGLFWDNLARLRESGLPIYLAFNQPDPRYSSAFLDQITDRFGVDILECASEIARKRNLIELRAAGRDTDARDHRLEAAG